MRRSRVAGLLLAAGQGARLGRPKALLEHQGERLVDRGVRLLEEGGCHPVVVVLGAATPQVRRAVTVQNPDWASGMGSSLRVGLAAVPAEAEAVVIALVDQPFVRPEGVRALIDSGAEVAVATYDGRRRNPVLIDRRHFAEVAALARGDVGARPFLASRPELVTEVACPGDPTDIDTLEDLRLLEAE
ncbi:nucleotidyltransferase family protein [Nonomuraea glycinis]|jgi:CTP:molybdopterin cytidylyltransferase MocA|uniref:4-diphosphocytidyl-2C-methyl-D-erythritol synthase n=1 Tax=Nonomuraea glycinis TaxID=2047744 RepID=A0A918A598_9ACTN|nr:nucleotidyltransferase family protein [Nonomuraea glycinis]MCA2178733.1 nucleotidyltransferase family protein [Nonomuraea glycinis]GGP07966.1 4-diphosphocytidyl-2C-methyl-D-erythritol synthase [Nonomuraea glycinis]